jgi:hypothetical protein
MKTLLAVIPGIFLFTLLSQCSSAQITEKKSFNIENASFQEWYGGRGSSKGVLISIELSNLTGKPIEFDSLYFRDKSVKLEQTLHKNKILLKGNFVTNIITDHDIIMHSDPRKELGNDVPVEVHKHLFNLTDNECIISYFVNNKKSYFKISNLTKSKPLYYP